MMSTTESDDDGSSVSSWASPSSNSSASSSNGSSASRASSSAASSNRSEASLASASTAAPPGKYKRRRRVYERIKAHQFYQPLATVHEGQELRDGHHSWFGPKIAGILVALIICIAGIKEGVSVLQFMVRGGEGGGMRYYGEDSEQLRRRKKGTNKLLDVKNVQDEEDDEDEEDYKLMRKVVVPPELQFLASIYEPILPTDRAFLWHVPRSAAATIKSIASQCFGLLLATEMGASTASNQITVITDLEGGNYLNVDTSSPDGIKHAKELNMANLPGLNFVSTSFFYDAAQNLFSDMHRGRCITMMRHPVERAASMYHLFASDPHSNVAITGMTLEDFANSDRVERNWMTRFLSNAEDNELKLEHLAIAKCVLEQKCLVGLLKFKWESLRRIETYFGWTLDGEKVNDCHTKLLDWNWPNKNKHLAVKEGSEAWRKLASVNELDMKLYKHAEKIYKIQGQRLFSNNK
jgi:hypothetical protein